MTTTVRAKFRVSRVQRDIGVNGDTTGETVTLNAVSSDSPDNKKWSKWTPNGRLEMQITNPSAIGLLTLEKEFYLDFVPVT